MMKFIDQKLFNTITATKNLIGSLVGRVNKAFSPLGTNEELAAVVRLYYKRMKLTNNQISFNTITTTKNLSALAFSIKVSAILSLYFLFFLFHSAFCLSFARNVFRSSSKALFRSSDKLLFAFNSDSIFLFLSNKFLISYFCIK